MRPALVFGIVAALAFAAPCTAEESASGLRYVAPDGEFSISLESNLERLFHAVPVTDNADFLLVDFPIMNSMGLALTWRRTVEWFKLEKPIDPSQYDRQATEAVDGYLQSRFGGKFVVADRGKFRDANGRLTYAFAAKGELNQLPAQWQGAVIFFDNGVALVSEVIAEDSGHHFESKSGVVNASLIDWAQTLHAGP
ncbi:MAG TPA: hypothetical protein VHZ78_12345 [Rhizomicrobium sp.]|jgi:hypothetical protein|nr:hypothetical protein [Rhizomicrobium sp.]